MTTTTIELVTYQLKPECSQSDLEPINTDVNAFLKVQPGFLYRSMSEDETGLMYDIVYWQDMQSAKNAADAFTSSKACEALMNVTNMESVTMRHMSAIAEVMSCEA
ncbi:hypothetical protein [Algibacillus agarilyticus]|uniref:hypothetical protein n=1 Tax=Algibacillus agarilyticus TaxID=2234133 RepID=UPI000DD0EA9C|nr:hypothetical protein [Algibacillus agarilyticus]